MITLLKNFNQIVNIKYIVTFQHQINDITKLITIELY